MSVGAPLYNTFSASRAYTYATVTNGTTTGDSTDRGDVGKRVSFVIATGTLTDGVHTFSLEDSDDGSSWGAAGASATLGTAVTAATDDNVVKELGYIGSKRYVRLKCVTSGATSGGSFVAIAVVDGGRRPVVR